MIATEDLTLAFGSKPLFENVSIKFTPGNCYGLIGANGAGKSTFLRCLAQEEDRASGRVDVASGLRVSVLRQDHFEYRDVAALSTVMQGHERLWQVMTERDAIYQKPDFNEEDGMRVGELEVEFADLDGYNAESNAAALLSALGVDVSRHDKRIEDLDDSEKVRVLLARALFGSPDVLLLDEPTNHLDTDSILWLEQFLLNFRDTVIVVSHDRHFLDKVCTHIADVDYQQVKLFTGNYTFWYETSQLALRQRQQSNKKKEDKMKELKTFIARFSANASKSKQASSRRTLLDKISLDDIKPSTRKYPYIVWKSERKLGKDVLTVEGLEKTIDGVKVFENLSFSLARGEKLAVTGDDVAATTLMSVLAGEIEPDAGTIAWGRSVNLGHFPKDHGHFFDTSYNLVDWMRQYSENHEESFVRSFLGRMLFTGEDNAKAANVLSGGEKVRCMLARMMLQDPNVLLLDGPTNHLDLESITALNNSLLKFEGSLIVTSHDVQFVDSLVTRVLELRGDTYFDLTMRYEDYLADEARIARAHRG